MKRLSSVLLVLGLCIFMVSTMWGQFTVTVTATDGVINDTLVLGTANGATFGIDSTTLGEQEEPPVPVAGTFDIRSVDFGTHALTHGAGCLLDLRPNIRPSQTDTFYINFQGSSESTIHDSLDITWTSVAGIGGGGWKLVDNYGGLYIKIDMNTASSARVPAEIANDGSAGGGFYIIHGDSARYTTVSYYRLCNEVDDKGKWGKATKGNKKTPWILPNVSTLGAELDKVPAVKASGLMQVGSDPIKSVVVKKYADLLKSSFDSKTSTTHTGSPTCLDSNYNQKPKSYAWPGDIDPVTLKPVKRPHPVAIAKQLKGMIPAALKGAQNNALFAQLATAKFNIQLNANAITPPYSPTVSYPALSALVITAPGVGDLFHKYDTKTVAQLISDADHYISCDSGGATVSGVTGAEYRDMLAAFNGSFTLAAHDTGNNINSVAHFDTASPWNYPPKGFVKFYTVKGNRPLSDVGFLERSAVAASGSGNIAKLLSAVQPRQYSLEQNYPNPFNPTTQISFNLIDKGFVTVKVFNMLGQEVATLASHEEMASGEQSVAFDAANYSSGVYFYNIIVNDEAGALKFQATRKMMLVK